MRKLCTAIALLLALHDRALAQHMDRMPQASMPNASGDQGTEESHDGHSVSMQQMHGLYGSYAATREASGTAWQPQASPMGGFHLMRGPWMFMLHGFAFGIYDYQEGKRGDDKFMSENMLMGMAQRPLGPGTLGLRSMLSLEPATIGRSGYPELLQTGETSNGRTPLIDRQHPHDFFMELAASYSVLVGHDGSAFVYFGYPGEPALGPATFMHRFSGMNDPDAPISHHWLDSTHITFGVTTLGYIWKQFKLDGSVFTGREPDQHRWDMDTARFDSLSARLTFNPTDSWSMQVSYGSINSPEQLAPDVDVDRITASVTYHRAWRMTEWQSTLAFGRNNENPGPQTDAFLLESAAVIGEAHTVMGRFERVEKNELFAPPDPRTETVYKVNRISIGYIYDFKRVMDTRFGVGAVGSVNLLPDALDASYGEAPLSLMVFVRVRL